MNRSFSIRRSDFYPIGSLDDKNNYKRFFTIDEDGSIRESIHLSVVDQSHREQLICMHYVMNLVRLFLHKGVGVNVVERDCPWDFRLQLSTGSRFFLEVTSVADSAEHYKINNSEERFTKWLREERIPLHELRKLAFLFPNDNLLQAVKELRQNGYKDSDLVTNPMREVNDRLFLTTKMPPRESLANLILRAIERKARKAHSGKGSTVLVIDNRTSAFGLSDYRSAAHELAARLDNMPFPEIWFYTGYCSDDDGNNAEFSFAPLKVSAELADVLNSLENNSSGVHVL